MSSLTGPSALSYSLSFAALSSILVHVWLWHRDEIREGEWVVHKYPVSLD